MLLNEMVGYDVSATNLYQTSPPGVPVQVLAKFVGLETVAPNNVPLVFVQVVAEVNVVALAQSSLTGGGVGCVTQIVKSAALVNEGLVPIFETRTK